MDEKIAKRWVKALRSGAYRQGTHELKSFDGRFCCLGVLQDVCEVESRPNQMFPSKAVVKAAKLKDKGGDLQHIKGFTIHDSLVRLNDGWHSKNGNVEIQRRSFREIADVIAKHWRAL